MQRYTLLITSLISCGLLSACGSGSVGKRLGMERQVPDEFRVLSRPPLSVPPEFSLRPPGEVGEYDGLMTPASKRAEETIFGTHNVGSALGEGHADTAVMPVMSSEAASQTDQNFLNRAGATSAQPDIRKVLRMESGETGYEDEKSMLEKLREPSNKEPTVDAKKEAERIKGNREEGKPVNEGEVELKEPKDRGILDKMDIF